MTKYLKYRHIAVIIIFALITLFFALRSALYNKSENLKLNHIQVIGSHNSYKQAIQPELFEIANNESDQLLGLEYDHLRLEDQLNLGLRLLELDVFYDPLGGRYSAPGGNDLLIQMGQEIQPFDMDGALSNPGFKVFHVQDIDFRSHCLLFTNCLNTIKQWSEGHPDHLPIVITLNVKTHPIDDPKAVVPLPFTPTTYDSLDQVIYDIVGRSKIITPGLIQKAHPTLNQAILKSGWPILEEVKGKFLFVLDEPMSKINQYLINNSIKDRLMFVNAPAGHPTSAFLIINDPLTDEALIKLRVTEGYIVRTRADADTREARRNDYARFEAAKRSGAQYISTDYYFRTSLAPDFLIQFDEENYVRCNPVTTDLDGQQIPCNL